MADDETLEEGDEERRDVLGGNVARDLAALVAGLTAPLGVGGFVLAALLLVFVGNPFSGVSTAPVLLPEWAAFVGQLLPPGAGGSLLRSSAFFDGNGGGGALAVLLGWATLGLAAVWAGTLRPRRGGALSGHPAARMVAHPSAAEDRGHATGSVLSGVDGRRAASGAG